MTAVHTSNHCWAHEEWRAADLRQCWLLGVLGQVEFCSINEWSPRICHHGGLTRSKVIGDKYKVVAYCPHVAESLTVPSRTKRPEAEVTGLRMEERTLVRRLALFSLTHRAVMAVRGARIACSRLPARPGCVPGLRNPDTGLPDCERGLNGQRDGRWLRERDRERRGEWT